MIQKHLPVIRKEPVILPEKYYLDYFHYLLDFVERQYDHILDEPEYTFYQAFRDLTEDAQCLYIRLSNRKGSFFRMSKIIYAEIKDIEAAKEELLLQDFIEINESQALEQFKLFTKQELFSLFDFLQKDLRKSEIEECLSLVDLPVIYEQEEIAELKRNEEVAFIKLLFFGNKYGQMTDFVVRDVGNVKIEPLDESKFKPWFESREEALAVMHVSQLQTMIKHAMSIDFPFKEFLKDIPWEQWLSHPGSTAPTEKLIHKIAYHFEQSDDLDEALKYYELSQKHPARERKIRVLQKLGREEEAIHFSQDIITSPFNASEQTFVHDFLNRSGIRINRSMTKMLKNAKSISIVKDPDVRVEQAVLKHFNSTGWDGFHTENFVWRGVFGLLFWDEIFDVGHGSFHHPLQRQPSDLNESAFFKTRASQLTKKVEQFKNRKTLINYLTRVHSEKDGIANRFVVWHEELLSHVHTIVSCVPLTGLKAVMLEMAKDMKENSTGFPDLFLWNKTTYRFYEVKSPNDHLSAQQLFWINFLKDQKIKVGVLRVNYLQA